MSLILLRAVQEQAPEGVTCQPTLSEFVTRRQVTRVITIAITSPASSRGANEQSPQGWRS